MVFPAGRGYFCGMSIPFRLSFGLTGSLLLHLGVFGLVLLLSKAPSPLPFGIDRRGAPTLVEISVQKTTSPVAVAKALLPRPFPEKVKTPSENLKASPTVSQIISEKSSDTFGSKSGTSEKGPLGVKNGVEVSEKQRYVYELRTLIEGRKTYPSLSQRLGEKGQVTVQFEVHKDGRIDKVVLKAKSLYPRLDEAALSLIKQISAYKPFPSTLTAESLTLEVPLNYQIN